MSTTEDQVLGAASDDDPTPDHNGSGNGSVRTEARRLPLANVEWREGDDHVLMTGPVEYEHKGRFDAALFADAGVA